MEQSVNHLISYAKTHLVSLNNTCYPNQESKFTDCHHLAKQLLRALIQSVAADEVTPEVEPPTAITIYGWQLEGGYGFTMSHDQMEQIGRGDCELMPVSLKFSEKVVVLHFKRVKTK